MTKDEQEQLESRVQVIEETLADFMGRQVMLTDRVTVLESLPAATAHAPAVPAPLAHGRMKPPKSQQAISEQEQEAQPRGTTR